MQIVNGYECSVIKMSLFYYLHLFHEFAIIKTEENRGILNFFYISTAQGKVGPKVKQMVANSVLGHRISTTYLHMTVLTGG